MQTPEESSDNIYSEKKNEYTDIDDVLFSSFYAYKKCVKEGDGIILAKIVSSRKKGTDTAHITQPPQSKSLPTIIDSSNPSDIQINRLQEKKKNAMLVRTPIAEEIIREFKLILTILKKWDLMLYGFPLL